MKKITMIFLVSVVALFANTETMELTGEYSEQLGNPFKKILNENKTKVINIYSEDKDVVLKVEDNLSLGGRSILDSSVNHPDEIVLKNKSVENVVEDFYSEDYIVKHSNVDAVVVNVESGTVSLTYNDDDNTQIHHLISMEVKLLVSVNGVEKEIVMDHKLGKEVGYKGFITTDDFDFSVLSLAYSSKIIENEIYKILQGI